MKKLIARLKGLGARRRWRSNAELLPKVLPRKLAEKVARECLDARLLVQSAAKESGRPERDLMAILAVRHGVPVAPEVHPVVLPALAQALSFEELRKAGAVPVAKDGRVVGLVVVDPQLAHALALQLRVSAYYLGTWFDVARALEASEELSRDFKQHLNVAATQKEFELAASLLRVICEDVRAYGAGSFVVRIISGKGDYRFETPSGAAAEGAIDSKVTPHVGAYLDAVEAGKRTETAGISAVEKIALGQYRVHLSSILIPVLGSAGLALEAKGSTKPCTEVATFDTKVVPFPGKSRSGESVSVAPASSRTTASAPLPPVAPLVPRSPSAVSTVLVVDDSPTFGAVVCRFLERQGVRALRCASGVEALKLLAEGSVRPHLIICDVHMPELGGEPFVRKVCEMYPGQLVPPLISVSSDTEVETELAMLAAGVDLFLPKTVDPRILCSYVEKLLHHRSTHVRGEVAC